MFTYFYCFIIKSLHNFNRTLAFTRTLIMSAFLLFGMQNTYAQKYTFTHYDIEDGLIQSQVNCFTEDKNHRLWMGTMGGLCNWNGKEFTAEPGLNSNCILSLFCDDEYNLWIGSRAGLSVLSNGGAFNYPSPVDVKNNAVTRIVQDKRKQTWLLMNYQLCKVQGKVVKPLTMPPQLKGLITTIDTNARGELFIAAQSKGIYKFVRNQWELVVAYHVQYSKLKFSRILFDKANPDQFFLMSEKALLKFSNNCLQPYEPSLLTGKNGTFVFMEQDKDFNLWISATSGAYRIGNGRITVFNSTNGFTDRMVTKIFNDQAGNLWLGTAGAGIYKYEGDNYTTLNNLPGLQSNLVVTGLAKQANGNILIGTDNTGLMQYDGKKLKQFFSRPDSSMVNFVKSLHIDKLGKLWLGATYGGLWYYKAPGFVQISGTRGKTINSIASDDNGVVWIAGPLGCRYVQNSTLYKVNGIDSYCSTVLPLNNDSVLVSNIDGVKLLVNKQLRHSFKIGVLDSSLVYCMAKYSKYTLIGTGGRGLVLYDLKTRKYRRCTVADGLNSDMVYSITTDNHGYVWVGTGRGVNKLRIDKRYMSFHVLENNSGKSHIVEASQNAILYDNDRVFVGTTKGVSIYNCYGQDKTQDKPYLVFTNIKFDIGRSDWDGKKPKMKRSSQTSNVPTITYKQNQLKISYLGIYLKNPESVYYQYKMAGLDSNFSQPVQTTDVDYLSLPPGNYTFIVKAGLSKRLINGPEIKFNFIITPPFYQTLTFRLTAVFVLIMLGGVIQYYYNYKKGQRRLMLDAIRDQEKVKIRQQTAEDFHDDLGNKLTRISVLSDILDTKIKDEPDQKNLVKQIKQNVDALYKGTKDILWALDPKSDNLFEILLHIKDFGRDLFEDTNVTYVFDDVVCKLDKIKLPMEYCRNLTMISKETLNNILRHANATRVEMSMILIDDNGISISIKIKDNGRGFDTAADYKGRGLNNINKRVKRINGIITISSTLNQGTTTLLEFTVPTHPNL